MFTIRQPTSAGVRAAADRVRGVVVETPLLPFDHDGTRVWIKAECLQTGGSFKLRGATNRLLLLSEDERSRGVVAFSSGNHAQGIAIAARRLGISATIVMPSDAPSVKRDASAALGATIVPYDRETQSREEIAGDIAARTGATLVPSFDDVDIIEGQGTCGVEIETQMRAAGDAVRKVLVPCGGGGLTAGIALALPDAQIVPVEPEGWDDMARSLIAGTRVPVAADAPATRCDALQTALVSPLTFDVLHDRSARGVAVSEADIAHAMRMAFSRLRLVVEPGGSVALAAFLAGRVPAEPGTVVVVSGGNVDPSAYAGVLST